MGGHWEGIKWGIEGIRTGTSAASAGAAANIVFSRSPLR